MLCVAHIIHHILYKEYTQTTQNIYSIAYHYLRVGGEAHPTDVCPKCTGRGENSHRH